MAKNVLISILMLLTGACVTINKSQPQQEQAQPEESGYRAWGGPGFYWGIYINNENDYWHHYNNHYNHGGHQGGGGHGGRGGGGGHR